MLKENYRNAWREDYYDLPRAKAYIPRSVRLWWLNLPGSLIVLITVIGGIAATSNPYVGLPLEVALCYFAQQTWPKRWLLDVFIGWMAFGVLYAWFIEGWIYPWL